MTPTPVPVDTAIIKFCTGNASDTAASAVSPSRATKMLSMILYKACTSMESIMGRDMVNSRRLMGMTPILFSAGFPEMVIFDM